VPQIEVKFDIDRDGLYMFQQRFRYRKEQSIRISAPKKLSKEEIDKMVKDAEKFAADDAKKREKSRLLIKRII